MSKLRLLTEIFDIYELKVFPGTYELFDAGELQLPSTQKNILPPKFLWEQRLSSHKSIARSNLQKEGNPSSLKNQMRKNTELIALQFAKLNIAKEAEIIAFCDQYGLPWEDSVLSGHLVSPNELCTKKGVQLSDLKHLILYIRHMNALIVEPWKTVVHRNHCNIFSAILFFFFVEPKSIKYDRLKPNSWPVQLAAGFDYFLAETRENYLKALKERKPIPMEDLDNVSVIKNYLTTLQTQRSTNEPDTVWMREAGCIQTVDTILKVINACPAMRITLGSEQGVFSVYPFTLPDKLTVEIESIGKALIRYLLDTNVQHLRLAIGMNNSGTLQRRIVAENLRDVMYLELYMMTVEPDSFNLCEACGHYYSKMVRNEGSKYCCTRCTNRIAKREERKRKRSNGSIRQVSLRP